MAQTCGPNNYRNLESKEMCCSTIQTAVLGLKTAIGLDTFVHLCMLNHFFHERQKSPFYLELR